jgi:pyruvate ferredoxin oxidoreductase alpha subunit
MVCVDGFVLTHAFEPVEPFTQEQADAYLPPIALESTLDPADPKTLGTYADPSVFTEARFDLVRAHDTAREVLDDSLRELAAVTGRRYGAAFDAYRVDGAETVLIAMGTAAQTARIVTDELRDEGVPAGMLALRSFRPFPGDELRMALDGARRVVVLDRAVSIGRGGIVAGEVSDALYTRGFSGEVLGVVAGLGGRDLSLRTLRRAFETTKDAWIDLDRTALEVVP